MICKLISVFRFILLDASSELLGFIIWLFCSGRSNLESYSFSSTLASVHKAFSKHTHTFATNFQSLSSSSRLYEMQKSLTERNYKIQMLVIGGFVIVNNNSRKIDNVNINYIFVTFAFNEPIIFIVPKVCWTCWKEDLSTSVILQSSGQWMSLWLLWTGCVFGDPQTSFL